MKKIKKAASILISFILVFGMTISAFAAESTTFTIEGKDANRIYEVYQIFTGDLHEGILSNIKWGLNGTGIKDTAVDKAVLEDIGSKKGQNQAAVDTVLKYVNLDSTAFGSINGLAQIEAPAGYYLIKDKDGSVPANEAYSTYILKVVENVEIHAKACVPTLEKKVKDSCDTDGTLTDWQDSADYDIGDIIPFQLTATVAQNYKEYDTYKFVFHDKESAGLTFLPDTVKVFAGAKEIKSGFRVETSPNDGDTFDVIFDNLKTIEGIDAGTLIHVQYSSKLNEHAVIGSVGNPNSARLEFSNNPNTGHETDTGFTPWDKVIVFTFEVTIKKYDQDTKALSGAEFTLKKLQKNENDVSEWVEKQVGKNEEGTIFYFKGLDAGSYCLEETVTPAGYNTIDKIYFIINAAHEIESDNPALTSLETVEVDENGNQVNKVKFSTTVDLTAGKLTAEIVNQKGLTFPETGGRGTTLLYALGTVFVAGAGIVLITRKRLDS